MTIVATLRGWVLRGLQAGTLEAGDRLPSARELVSEFGVDHRLILEAYRQLSSEGLVDVRERGGVYVSAERETVNGLVVPPVSWFVDTLTDAFAHEIPTTEVHEWLRRVTETLRLRALVISTTEDQVAGLCRELNDDFGLLCDGFTGNELRRSVALPPALRRVDVIVSTIAHEVVAQELAGRVEKPVITIDVRPDMAVGEWALLLRQPVWAIVATREFGEMLKHFFQNVKGIENLTILIHGEDDLSEIPSGAPTYVTHHVRQMLGATQIPGRILPPARTIATTSARLILEFIVSANLSAMRGIRAAVAQYKSDPPVGDSETPRRPL